MDAIFATVLAFPHGNSKCEEHVFNIVGGLVQAPVIEREQFAMPGPRLPVAIPHGAVHCCSTNCFLRNVLKTLDFSCRGTIANCNACYCGSGNVESKAETSSWSDKLGALLEIVHRLWMDAT